MKMERLNEKQIKFVFSRTDLLDKNINLDELAYGSDKAREFFRDIMQEAFDKFGFESENTPLMIEAMPSNEDKISIIVTKVADKDEKNNHLKDLIKTSKDKGNKKPKEFKKKSPYMIFRFDNIDEVSELSAKLNTIYFGTNSLYKLNDEFLLLVHKDGIHKKSYAYIKALLNEFGEFVYSSSLSENFLKEQGETMIEENAIEILGKFLA